MHFITMICLFKKFFDRQSFLYIIEIKTYINITFTPPLKFIGAMKLICHRNQCYLGDLVADSWRSDNSDTLLYDSPNMNLPR